MLDKKLSLILPAHNEAENIEVVVGRALEVLPQVFDRHEVIVVNDGSRDATGEIIDRLAASHATVSAVHHQRNQGYGSALRSGFNAATGDLIMFMDADRQFDIADVARLAPFVPSYDIVAGYRIRRQDALYRHIYAKIFDIAVLTLFGVHVKDVDCAFKIYDADLVKAMPLTMPGALINTEMLAMSRRMGATIVEVGVNHYPRLAGVSSGGSPKVVLRAMGETMRLWWRMRNIDVPAIGRGEPGHGGITPLTGLIAAGALVVAITSWLTRKR